jgi:hypothetical protein
MSWSKMFAAGAEDIVLCCARVEIIKSIIE